MTDFSPGNRTFERAPRARRASRAIIRYIGAICIGIAATLAWQSYGEEAKQIIATRASQLGWSPEAQQTIAGLIRQLGWTKPSVDSGNVLLSTAQDKPQAALLAQIAPESAAQNAPATPSLELQQAQRMIEDLAGLRQTVEQLATGQDQMAHEIAKLQAANQQILEKVSTPPPRVAAASPRKLTPPASPRSRTPMPLTNQ